MAKAKIMDSAKQLDAQAKELFERIKKVQTDVTTALQNVRRAESVLIEKEQAEERERLEKEKQERLMEVLASEGSLAAHFGHDEKSGDFVETAALESDPVIELSDTPRPSAPREAEPEKKAEPGQAEDNVQPLEAREETERAVERPIVEEPKPNSVIPFPQPSDIRAEAKEQSKAPQHNEQEVNQNKPRQEELGGYQQRPQGQGGYPQRPQGPGGYQQRPQGQGGYQQRPQGQGGYQQRPQGQGGYQQRPQGQGGYQQRPQGQGGYQQRPQGQGGYQQRPQGQGGYQQRPQGQGGYQQRPQGQGGYQQRPQGQGGGRTATSASTTTPANKERVSNYDPNKGVYARRFDTEKKSKSKKAILKETSANPRSWDEDASGIRRPRKTKQQAIVHRPEPVRIEKAIMTSETITVKELSEKIGKPAAEIIKKLFVLGTLATINQEVDYDTCSLIASDYGIELELQLTKTFEDVLQESSDDAMDDAGEMEERPPVVTIMGHVDHGKTSLLDAIRNSSVTEGEAGGITQHIGAYTVTCNGRTITFIDTPGHEAFTSMRARGAQVTDIVILVVAADDGIMPQTIEAINHAKAAEVPIIVAINKMDRDTADPERIKQQLTEHELVTEEWGGDTLCVPVSAKTRVGIDSLLEMILLQADVLELKANPHRIAKGAIIEAQLHKGKGPIATVLVQNGTLKVGDPIVAGTAYGRVRAMMDDKGRRVNQAGPSCPVEVLGFSEVPSAGDTLNVSEIDKLSRQVAEERRDKQKVEQLKNLSKVSLDDLFSQIAEGQVKDLNIIVKADVQGSVEAVKQALEKLSNEEVRVRCIHGGVGAITGSDIMFASASNAIVIGFNVRPDASARTLAEKEKVDMRLYRIIYNAIEDVQNAMKGMFAPVFNEVELGRISVRNTFKVSGVGTIAGAYVQEGKVSRNAQVRVVRDGIVVHEGKISSLKRFKDDAKEVATGYECGIGIEGFNDVHEGDVIEAFVMEEVKR